jgi:ribosomal protein S19
VSPEGKNDALLSLSEFDNTYRFWRLFVHNFSFSPGKKGKIARAAGVSGQIISKNDKYCRIRLNSGEHRFFLLETLATLGTVSNSSHKLVSLGKAGRSRWLNRRPTVRGVAMNPIDHPHGGGEGKTSGGRPSVTPWGFPARGRPTRKKKLHHLILKKKKKMSKRSAWKGPFVDFEFLEKSLKPSSKKILETRSRNSLILPYFIGRTIKVYNGKKYVAFKITEEMVGFKLGEFVLTRLRHVYKKKIIIDSNGTKIKSK